MHWAAAMALKLLQERHSCRQSSSSSTDQYSDASASSSDSSCWQPWIASLPQSVVTPAEFTSEEVQQLVLPSTRQVKPQHCCNAHMLC